MEIKEVAKSVLFNLFGEGDFLHAYDKTYIYESDKFEIVACEKKGKFIVSVTLMGSFDKVSKCPMHFLIQERNSKRYINRLKKAINFLLRFKDFELFRRNFDDLSQDVVWSKFYN